ncbi:phospholipase A2-like [Centruroides sculpturatus]|uniref:phospholipase A2-like n=1 Tax=Centruroides sculpturatus TaxID=218467 RepID=UPI000C6DD5B3|nr:phospholipase A2-like [Centruroides sculpturatus]
MPGKECIIFNNSSNIVNLPETRSDCNILNIVIHSLSISNLISNILPSKVNVSDPLQGVAIVPGTKWCGRGDRAKNDSDLGIFKKTDSCCRQHDKCPVVINPGETKYNLTNDGVSARVSCECDQQLRQCLKTVNEEECGFPSVVGVLFFDVLRIKCINCTQTDNTSSNSEQPTASNATKCHYQDSGSYP